MARRPVDSKGRLAVIDIDPDVADNYRALKVERGLSWAQLAEQAGAHRDRNLAAWCREQASPDAGDAPKGRRAAPKSEA